MRQIARANARTRTSSEYLSATQAQRAELEKNHVALHDATKPELLTFLNGVLTAYVNGDQCGVPGWDAAAFVAGPIDLTEEFRLAARADACREAAATSPQSAVDLALAALYDAMADLGRALSDTTDPGILLIDDLIKQV